MKDSFSILNQTKGKLPRLPFLQMKNAALGAKYELSVVFTGDALTRKLNKEHRGKDKPANVLSFPLSKTAGELFLNPSRAAKEASKFDRSKKNFLAFLFIHGLVHLQGHDHGRAMDAEEEHICRKFKI